jgi:predicted GNAT superfamily acetyltransferase
MNQNPDKTIFSIRPLSAVDDFVQAEILQRDVWGMKDLTEIVPKDMMIIVQKNGGLALGAFNPENIMIALLFGFPGRTTDNHYKHCSHMMGVLPFYRHSGVGEALKLRQRDFVVSQGLDLITWTVNPLEGVNATLNFGKLGVICRHLYRNLYGEMTDGLNRGMPSDRFEVEWWVKSPRVEKRIFQKPTNSLSEMQQAGAKFVNKTIFEQGIRIPKEIILSTDAPMLLFEIPADFQAVKIKSVNTALLWCDHARTVFEACFKNGYIVSEFISETGKNERRNFYVLQRDLTKILAA